MTQRGPGKPDIRVVDIATEDCWLHFSSLVPQKGELGTVSTGYRVGLYLTVVEGGNWRDPILKLWIVFCCEVVLLT